MKWKDLLENWGMTSLKLKAGFLETEWKPTDPDKDAARDLYIELLALAPRLSRAASPQAGWDSVAFS
jgi:hypothetical protein